MTDGRTYGDTDNPEFIGPCPKGGGPKSKSRQKESHVVKNFLSPAGFVGHFVKKEKFQKTSTLALTKLRLDVW